MPGGWQSATHAAASPLCGEPAAPHRDVPVGTLAGGPQPRVTRNQHVIGFRRGDGT